MAENKNRRRITQELLVRSYFGVEGAALEPWVVDRIAETVEEYPAKPGDVLYRVGDPSDHILFVSDGRIRLRAEGHPDWIYKGDWVLGTTDLLAKRRRQRTATVEAVDQVFRIPSDVWRDMQEDSFDVSALALTGSAAANSRIYTRLAPTGGFLPPSDRAARFEVGSETLLDRTALLHETPLLCGAGVQSLTELARHATVLRLAPGTSLFERGAPSGRAHVVVAGQIEARREQPDIRARFGPGSVVGAALCLGDVAGEWQAEAVEDSSVLSFAIEDWLDAMEEHPSLANAAMVEMAVERERLCDLLAGDAPEVVLE